MFRRVLTVAVALLAMLPGVAAADVLKIVVDDVIHPISEEFITRTLDEAKKSGDQLVLIEFRTPGGLETSTRVIVNRILSSSVPVAVYVSPSGSRAASAGFFILVAADVAAMAPGTNTGAAHPVLLWGNDKIDEIMKAKIENDSSAFMRSIAAKRGRNVAVAESAVRESKSFTEQEALAQGVIDLVARDQAELLRMLDGRTVTRFNGSKMKLVTAGLPVRENRMTLRQQVLSFIMDPNVAFILFSLGMLALWAEFNHPGAILPGVVGLISILLAVFALNILPTRFAALILLVAAFGLFALEAKLASHGVLGIGGVICMVIGALLLVDGPIPELRVSLLTALAVSIPFGIIAVFLMSLVIRAHKGRVVTGEQGMVGEVGTAKTDLAPAGRVFVHGEIWNAVADSAIPAGSQVRVEDVDTDGLTLKVARVE